MCGIAGMVGHYNYDAVRLMLAAQIHRGPDDEGIWTDPKAGVTLAHCRLAIIDLSSAGHQPMSYGDGRYRIIFNGEIYNFMEIRNELEQLGNSFQSITDTEVILAAYAQWGSACVKRLRGMFAFAIWDSVNRQLFLARDRFGIKPLYFSYMEQIFLFASELKALIASQLIDLQVDQQAIWDYLSFGTIPQPRTILSHVQSLLPGHHMIVDESNVTIEQYWDIEKETSSQRKNLAKINYQDTVSELRRHLLEATRYHLIADVQIGAFLSGGVDSTAIVGLMSQFTNQPIKTYCVGFDKEYQHLNEFKWARIAAQHFGTEHTEVIVNNIDAAKDFGKLISAIDQPSIDGMNTYFVSQAARQGVTVSLSGLGGDELFAGYPHFQNIVHSQHFAPNGFSIMAKLYQKLKRGIPGRWQTTIETLISSPLERLSLIRLLMSEKEKEQVVHPKWLHDLRLHTILERYRPLLRAELDLVSQISYIELSGYLSDTLLRDTDMMSMAHALEIRPVLLDHKLAEFAFSLPPQFKLNKKVQKRVFIDAMRYLLPKEIVNRPKKGFALPLADWLGTTLLERATEAFSTESASTLFTSQFLAACKCQLKNHSHQGFRLWAYFILLEYIRCYNLKVA